ncbi:MAG: hypothetical protein U1F43_14435 [Myxococcota bacterium]
MSTASAPQPAREPQPTPPARLDDLLALDTTTLAALYRDASVPAVPDLSGDLRGRMLAWEGVRGPVAAALRALASSAAFPWRGKSFAHDDGAFGQGKNRVFSDKLRLFRFTTRAGQSRAGDFDAVQLDYDHAENPRFIRAIKDEVRELRPGLWLGQAWLQWSPAAAPRLVLWFGLEKP